MKGTGEGAASLIDDLPQPAFVLDGTGCFLQVNRMWCNMTGYTPQEVVGELCLADLCSASVDELCRLPEGAGPAPSLSLIHI